MFKYYNQMINTHDKFSKVELLKKELGSLTKVEFLNCYLMIIGNHIIITTDEHDESINALTSTNKIFSLDEISSYKTYDNILKK